MQSDNLTQLLQKGFHMTLGATSFLIETLQDVDKREDNLRKLRTDIDGLTEEWVHKGESIEQEARNFVDTIVDGHNQPTQTSESETAAETLNSPASPPTVPIDIQRQEIQDLTAQVAALRAELEKLQVQDSQP